MYKIHGHFTMTLAVLICLGAAGRMHALEPAEVGVVANADSEPSQAIAREYMAARGIPEENLILVRTTTKYEVGRGAYVSEIRDPIRAALEERDAKDRIKSLVLTWGVPVRVAAGDEARVKAVQAAFDRAGDKLHYRLAIAYELLDSVGDVFPEPETDDLTPLGKLFPRRRVDPDPLPKLGKLLGREQAARFGRKHQAMTELEDPDQRRIAERQLMGVIREVNGLRGLVLYIKQTDPEEHPKLGPMLERMKKLAEELRDLQVVRYTPERAEAHVEKLAELTGVGMAANHARQMSRRFRGKMGDTAASVDSELSMLWWGGYETSGWRPNLLHWRVAPSVEGKGAPPTLMTCRIDGPTPEIARRIFKDSIAAEEAGPAGRFYIDAGGRTPADKGLENPYNANLRKLADIVRPRLNRDRIEVRLDSAEAVLGPGEAPDAALYVGWYSLRRYVPAFEWKQGAVGWHIASFEAMHLRDPDSREWCVKMLQNGVAATLGPVKEPFLQAFPLPQEFFPLLLTGECTLAECYWRTVPSTSWMMTLIGDPLYNPYRADPALDVGALPRGLAPAKSDERGE